jgi:ABC-type phosphate/phosphonate transport system substrate-binding protein
MLDKRMITRRSFMGLAGAATAMLATACSNATTTTEQKAEEPTNPA